MPGPQFAVLWGVYVRAVLGWFGKIIGILGIEYADVATSYHTGIDSQQSEA